MNTTFRFIPDAECVQSRCANTTTGCRDVCMMRNPPWCTAPLPAAPAPTEQATFDRRWSLARDGFGLVRDDAEGNYVAHDDAVAVIHAALAARLAPDAGMDTRDGDPDWVIVQRPGFIPVRKGPFSNAEQVAEMLHAMHAQHPECACMVINMPRTSYPESGREWLAIHAQEKAK